MYDPMNDEYGVPTIPPLDPNITDHRYDCGPDELTGGPCIADSGIGSVGLLDCGQPRAAHAYTEYDHPLEEPGYYPTESLHFDDDSYDHLHPYVD